MLPNTRTRVTKGERNLLVSLQRLIPYLCPVALVTSCLWRQQAVTLDAL